MSDDSSNRPRSAPAASPSTPPAEEWRANWARTLPELERITRRLQHAAAAGPPDVSIMRSSQLDAARLDEELGSMLREQFLRAFALFNPAAVARLQPELTLLLDLLIFRFSIWEGRPLPGMALMNLRYRNEAAVQRPFQQASLACGAGEAGCAADAAAAGGSTSSGFDGGSVQHLAGGHSGVDGPGLSGAQRGLYCLGAVLLRYGWARLGQHAAASHWGDPWAGGGATPGWRLRCWNLMRSAESAYCLASLANFLVFLRTGRYRSLVDRVLRARLVYRQPSAARAISFEYLNRQLVWSELSELLLFLLPLVNAKAIKHALRSYLPRLPILSAGTAGAAGGGGGAAQAGAEAQQACPVCGTGEILNPWAAQPCGHTFCYYCLRSNCLADPEYSCPLCLQRVAALRPCVAQGGGAVPGDGVGDSGGTGGK